MIASYSQKLLYIKDGVIAKQVVKGDLTQKEYFHKIVDVNSAESMSLFEGNKYMSGIVLEGGTFRPIFHVVLWIV